MVRPEAKRSDKHSGLARLAIALAFMISWQVIPGASEERRPEQDQFVPEGEIPRPSGEERVADLVEAAEAGSAKAQFKLGGMYEQGRGVGQDDEQAVAWFRKAAEQGHPAAQVSLGMMYADGRGVGQNDEQAVAWFLKAAEQGDPNAQYTLGVAYAYGRGVGQDDEQAVAWYRKAAGQGVTDAMLDLAGRQGADALVILHRYASVVHIEGRPSTPPPAAMYWICRAAESADATAAAILDLLQSPCSQQP